MFDVGREEDREMLGDLISYRPTLFLLPLSLFFREIQAPLALRSFYSCLHSDGRRPALMDLTQMTSQPRLSKCIKFSHPLGDTTDGKDQMVLECWHSEISKHPSHFYPSKCLPFLILIKHSLPGAVPKQSKRDFSTSYAFLSDLSLESSSDAA